VQAPVHTIRDEHVVRDLVGRFPEGRNQCAALGHTAQPPIRPVRDGGQPQHAKDHRQEAWVYLLECVGHRSRSRALKVEYSASISLTWRGNASSAANDPGTATSLPISGSTISLNLAGCAVATSTQ